MQAIGWQDVVTVAEKYIHILHFPFPVCLIFAAFYPFPFSILCSHFSFPVSFEDLFGCVCHLSFRVSRFTFLVLRLVVPVVPPLTSADFTELERRHRQMEGSD